LAFIAAIIIYMTMFSYEISFLLILILMTLLSYLEWKK